MEPEQSDGLFNQKDITSSYAADNYLTSVEAAVITSIKIKDQVETSEMSSDRITMDVTSPLYVYLTTVVNAINTISGSDEITTKVDNLDLTTKPLQNQDLNIDKQTEAETMIKDITVDKESVDLVTTVVYNSGLNLHKTDLARKTVVEDITSNEASVDLSTSAISVFTDYTQTYASRIE